MAGCSCGKAEKCAGSRHPDTQSSRRFSQATPVLHMERRPGETFQEMAKRTGVAVPASEVELQRPQPFVRSPQYT